ncbi:MAG TPA: MFS transporter [Xanthobacteraceae bacterium]|nr:MFS transporter [Xanthobacteraceae bacterium]
MTEAISVRAFRPAESRLIAGVCAAHMMSHYYMLMLAPLFAIIRADFNVSYTELALALTVFNVVSGVLQTPVGFLVDRIGARVVLIAGLALSTIAYAVAGMVDSYWVFIAMYGVAGVGNTVFHPSDYSLLSNHAPPERLSHVFSYHTFAGMVGSAIAPVTLLYMQSQFGWRGAYVGASIFGLLVLLALIAQPEPAPDKPRAAKSFAKTRPGVTDAGWRLLLSPPILLNLAYFVLTSIMSGGLNTYLVVALGALHGTPAAVANMALTALLAMNAVGVLVGGVLAGRTSHHAAVAASGLAIGGTVTALIGWFALPSAGLILLMAFSGLCVGVTMPSRDMLVRSVTPPNAYGRVFGFVSMGFNIGASVAPIVYGALMDRGQPLMVFMLSAAVCIICISTVTFGFAGRETR